MSGLGARSFLTIHSMGFTRIYLPRAPEYLCGPSVQHPRGQRLFTGCLRHRRPLSYSSILGLSPSRSSRPAMGVSSRPLFRHFRRLPRTPPHSPHLPRLSDETNKFKNLLAANINLTYGRYWRLMEMLFWGQRWTGMRRGSSGASSVGSGTQWMLFIIAPR